MLRIIAPISCCAILLSVGSCSPEQQANPHSLSILHEILAGNNPSSLGVRAMNLKLVNGKQLNLDSEQCDLFFKTVLVSWRLRKFDEIPPISNVEEIRIGQGYLETSNGRVTFGIEKTGDEFIDFTMSSPTGTNAFQMLEVPSKQIVGAVPRSLLLIRPPEPRSAHSGRSHRPRFTRLLTADLCPPSASFVTFC
jgi:hypothetical protein